MIKYKVVINRHLGSPAERVDYVWANNRDEAIAKWHLEHKIVGSYGLRCFPSD